jgi:hypothetical protein
MPKRALAAALLLASATASAGHAQQAASALDEPADRGVRQRCAEVSVEVTAASPIERQRACDAAGQALRRLERCNISPRTPLRIEILGEVRRPSGGTIFGGFDPVREGVLVTRYENIAPLAAGTPFGLLPQGEFYKSLIFHEVVHAVMHQNYKRRPTNHAAYEYPAYALQIESLPQDVREKFLQAFDVGADKNEFRFSDTILAFDPFFFAARAYEHFRASPDGCAHLHALLAGDSAFIWVRGSSR